MKKRQWILLLVLILLLVELIWQPEPSDTGDFSQYVSGTLQVHFLDVGHADCALLQCGDQFALIDGGNYADGAGIVAYLEKQGVEKLELVVGTHPHEDHIGGLSVVLEAFPAEQVWTSAIPDSSKTVTAFLDAISDQGLTPRQPEPGATFQLGDAVITVLGPVRTDYEDANDLSLVLMVQFGSSRFLFTGDMEQTAERDLLESGADVRADVLKVGHHGSSSSTGYLFLRAVAPTWGVLSLATENSYGHPNAEPMSRLRDAEVIVHRTDRQGTIVVITDGIQIDFRWENSDAEPGIPTAADVRDD